MSWAMFFSAFCASASGGSAVASLPPAPPSALLGEIFERQQQLLDTLRQQLIVLHVRSGELQSQLGKSLDELEKLQHELQMQQEASKQLESQLAESERARQALKSSLTQSSSSLNAAQISLRRAAVERWVVTGAAALAGAIVGGLFL